MDIHPIGASPLHMRLDTTLQALRHQPPWERMPVPRRLGPPATGLEADNRTLRAVLTPAQTQRLYAVLRGEANLNMMLLTALAMAIREWSNQRLPRRLRQPDLARGLANPGQRRLQPWTHQPSYP